MRTSVSENEWSKTRQIPAAEERKYQLGAETIFFVLDAQNQLSQAELSLVQAQIAYQRALAEVDHATGTLLSSHMIDVASH